MGGDPDEGSQNAMAVAGEAGRAPVIVVHSPAHAIAALRAAQLLGRVVVLASAPGAGIYGGPGWFGGLIAAAHAAAPAAQFAALLDCSDDAGAAQGAIRAGIAGTIFNGPAEIALRLADVAAQAGLTLATVRPEPALDLGRDFFAPPETLYALCIEVLGVLQLPPPPP